MANATSMMRTSKGILRSVDAASCGTTAAHKSSQKFLTPIQGSSPVTAQVSSHRAVQAMAKSKWLITIQVASAVQAGQSGIDSILCIEQSMHFANMYVSHIKERRSR